MNPAAIAGMFAAAIAAIVLLIIIILFAKLYIRAWASQATVPVKKLIGMKLRKVPPGLIVEGRIRIRKAGIDIETDQLEAHYLSGGDVINVINAIIAADKANMMLSFKDAAAIDLAGRDIYEAVRTSVQPKVIDCPDPKTGGAAMLDAVEANTVRDLISEYQDRPHYRGLDLDLFDDEEEEEEDEEDFELRSTDPFCPFCPFCPALWAMGGALKVAFNNGVFEVEVEVGEDVLRACLSGLLLLLDSAEIDTSRRESSSFLLG